MVDLEIRESIFGSLPVIYLSRGIFFYFCGLAQWHRMLGSRWLSDTVIPESVDYRELRHSLLIVRLLLSEGLAVQPTLRILIKLFNLQCVETASEWKDEAQGTPVLLFGFSISSCGECRTVCRGQTCEAKVFTPWLSIVLLGCPWGLDG